MTDQHPITPPPELAAEWVAEIYGNTVVIPLQQPTLDVITRATQWGADQELDAIIRLAGEAALPEKDRYFDGLTVAGIMAARRPKPPSLKKQALEALDEAVKMSDYNPPEGVCTDQADIIRRALEALPDD